LRGLVQIVSSEAMWHLDGTEISPDVSAGERLIVEEEFREEFCLCSLEEEVQESGRVSILRGARNIPTRQSRAPKCQQTLQIGDLSG